MPTDAAPDEPGHDSTESESYRAERGRPPREDPRASMRESLGLDSGRPSLSASE